MPSKKPLKTNGGQIAEFETADYVPAVNGGVPPGGTASQVLKKNSATDFDYSWGTDNTGGGGGSSPVVITPAQITADQDNYSPTDWATATHVRLSFGDTMSHISGFNSTGITDGTEKVLINVGAKIGVICMNHPDSDGVNRVKGGSDFLLFPNDRAVLTWDSTASRWLISGDQKYASGARTLYYTHSAGSVTAADLAYLAIVANTGTIASSGAVGAGDIPAHILLGTGTGAATGHGVGFSKSVNTIGVFEDCHKWAECLIQIPTISDGTNPFVVDFCIANNWNTAANVLNNRLQIRYTHSENGGNFSGTSRDNAGTETLIDLGVTVAVNTTYKLRIEQSKGGEARFFINDDFKGVISTNLPTGGLSFGARIYIYKGGSGSSTRTLRVINVSAGAEYNI